MSERRPWIETNDTKDLVVLPVELADELEDLVDRLLDENIMEEVPDEKLHRGALLLLDCGSLGRVALRRADLSSYPCGR